MATYQFQGTIIDKSSAALSTMRVDAFDAARLGRPLASAPVLSTGEFVVQVTDELLTRYFGDTPPQLFFRVSRPTEVLAHVHRECLASTERSLTWTARQDATGTIQLDSSQVLAALPAENPVYTIEGVVADTNGPSAGSSITVKRLAIVEGDLDENAPLVLVPAGPITADGNGRFKIGYEAPVSNPDLLLIATLTSGTAELRITRAEPAMFVRIVAQGMQIEKPTYGDLKTRIDDSGEAPAALENANKAMYDHLAARTGRTVDVVRRLADAASLAISSNIDASPGIDDGEEVFFALVQPGVNTTERDLYAQGIPTLRRTVESASTARDVKKFSPSQLDTRMGAIETRAVELMRTSRVGELAVGDLVSTMPEPTMTPTKRDNFTRLVPNHQADAATFWTNAASVLTPTEITAARFTVTAAALAGFHRPLVARLQQMRQADSALLDPSRIAALGPERIDDEIDGLGLNASPPGVTVADYKKAVKDALAKAYPTAWLEGSLPTSDVKSDLKNHRLDYPDFTFESSRLSKTPTEVTAELRQLERMHRVAPTPAVTQKLIIDGFETASGIRMYGHDRFISTMTTGDLAIPIEDIEIVERAWENAGWQEFASSAAQSIYSPAHGAFIGVLKSPVVDDPPLAAPDWATLFGSLDSCACAHCQSVYGPNAYFVDLLEFLSHQLDPAAEFANLRERLFALRPDLKHLILDCDTATTPLPQIDLINEILELLVASAPGSWPSTRVGTTTTAPLLEAAPEIKHPTQYTAAYNTLKAAKYPFSVPFSIWNAQIDAMLEHLGVRRSRIIDILGAGTAKENWMWMASAGVSADLQDILKTPRPDATDHLYWGLSSATPLEIQMAMRTFMAAAQLSFEEVQELIAVNWGGSSRSRRRPNALSMR